MKEFIFVSDFDGTLTKKDFYLILIEKYLMDKSQELFELWKNGKYKDIEFLHLIFSSANRTQEEFLEDILSIELDNYFEDFVEQIKSKGGDFLVLSAGTSYYIEKLFLHKGIDVPVISNKGEFKNNGIHVIIDKNAPYYSESYGIDKGKIVKNLKTKYKKIYFAGDSHPDTTAAQNADIAFAKSSLKKHLDSINHPYIPFNNFLDIKNYLLSIKIL